MGWTSSAQHSTSPATYSPHPVSWTPSPLVCQAPRPVRRSAVRAAGGPPGSSTATAAAPSMRPRMRSRRTSCSAPPTLCSTRGSAACTFPAWPTASSPRSSTEPKGPSSAVWRARRCCRGTTPIGQPPNARGTGRRSTMRARRRPCLSALTAHGPSLTSNADPCAPLWATSTSFSRGLRPTTRARALRQARSRAGSSTRDTRLMFGARRGTCLSHSRASGTAGRPQRSPARGASSPTCRSSATRSVPSRRPSRATPTPASTSTQWPARTRTPRVRLTSDLCGTRTRG
mmetsp:Transcript_32442/g.80327  ORF Transcript_32442/g.80327 Transcript_32442/m.80327 type:complete len:287 (-) Transcript_32442:302-1162(-)